MYFAESDFLTSGHYLHCSISPWAAAKGANLPHFPLHGKLDRSAVRTRVMANVWQLKQAPIFQDAGSPAAAAADDTI